MDDGRPGRTGTTESTGSSTVGEPGGRRTGLVFASVVAAVAVVLGAAVLVVDHRREARVVDAATARLVAHTDELAAEQDDLTTAVEAARETRAMAEPKVSDDVVLSALDDQIVESEWAAAPYTLVGEPSDDLDMLTIQDAFVLDHLATVERAGADLAAAVTAVESAVDG